MSEAALERFQEQVGRECPYVELEPANVLLADVVPFALDERLRGLLEGAFADSTHELPREERQVLRSRLARALGSGRVNDALYPERRRARERAAAERGQPPPSGPQGQ